MDPQVLAGFDQSHDLVVIAHSSTSLTHIATPAIISADMPPPTTKMMAPSGTDINLQPHASAMPSGGQKQFHIIPTPPTSAAANPKNATMITGIATAHFTSLFIDIPRMLHLFRPIHSVH
jgi:hypothetical protein